MNLSYFLLLALFKLVTANLRVYNFKMTYDNVNDVVVMTCKVPKGQWFSVGFGKNMLGAGAISFQGYGDTGTVQSLWMGNEDDPKPSALV
jgi:hypothetical protein